MTPEITTTVSYPRDPRLLPRDHATALRNALRNAAVEHHRQHIPRHFMPFAAAKYGYSKRSDRYQKLKNKRGLPPLVSPRRTGGAMRLAVTSARQVTATQNRARLIMRAPFTGGTGRVRMRPGQTQLTTSQKTVMQIIGELTAISSDEQTTINQWITDFYKAEVESFIAGGGITRVGRGGATRTSAGRFVKRFGGTKAA